MTWIAARSHWLGACGLVAFIGMFGVLEVGSYNTLAQTAVERAQVTALFRSLARTSSYLLAPTDHPELLRGYVQWFLIGWIPGFFTAWAAIAGGGAGRGDEEKGLVEQWMGWGVRRANYIAARITGYTLAVAVTCIGIDAVLIATNAAAGTDLEPVSLVEQTFAQAASILPIFTLALVSSQLFVSRRAASGVTGLVAGGLYLLNGFARTIPSLQPFRWLTPYAYADRSDAMVPHGHFDLAATLVPVAATVVLGVIAAWLMGRRDLYDAAFVPRASARKEVRTASDGAETLPVLWRLWDQRVGLLVWSAATGLYALSVVPLARPFVQTMTGGTSSTASEQATIAFGMNNGGDPLAAFVGTVWFRAACLLIAIYAVTQVARWASEDSDGRLEWMLSMGRSRWAVQAERIATVIAAMAVIALGDLAGVFAGALADNLHLDAGRVVLAAALTIPLGLAFAGAGAAIAAWRPRVSVAVAVAVLAMSYMIPFAAVPIFKTTPPDWFLDLSAFHLYGSPMAVGIDRTGTAILLAAAAAGFVVALLALQRRDVTA